MKRISTVLFAACALLLAAAPAAPAAVVELGVSKVKPPSSCPEPCFAVGRVTGYQVTQAGSARNPFQVTRPGKIVAFSIKLGKPTSRQSAKFAEFFGGPSQARISILRRGTRNRHRLLAQSPVYRLSRYFGSTPTFALPRPLKVAKGEIVALTVPTWAPALAVDLGNDEAWRASRGAGTCDDASQKAAQQRIGGLRTYGCLYRTGRLRYSATFVPTPRPTS